LPQKTAEPKRKVLPSIESKLAMLKAPVCGFYLHSLSLSLSLSLVKNKGYSLVLEERASPDIEEAFAVLSATFSLANFPSILLCIGISLARWPLACVEVPCGFRF